MATKLPIRVLILTFIGISNINAWASELDQEALPPPLPPLKLQLQELVKDLLDSEESNSPRPESLRGSKGIRKKVSPRTTTMFLECFASENIVKDFQENIIFWNDYLRNPWNLRIDYDLCLKMKNLEHNDAIMLTQALELTNLRLTFLPLYIFAYKHLKTLDVSSNSIQHFPRITSLPALTMLNLSHNDIAYLPEEIGILSNLEELILDNNHLTALPKSLLQLKKITRLCISNNQLDEVPSRIYELKSLQFLGLTNNNLRTLPKEMGQLPRLLTLALNGNPLCELPYSLCQLGKLSCLNLAAVPALRHMSQLFFGKKRIREAFAQIFENQSDWEAFRWGITPEGRIREDHKGFDPNDIPLAVLMLSHNEIKTYSQA
ncbi:leucine-rich repeat domain-containing protein [Candidatus Odyssella thessalonicensis]|uniref:leucine-rich repeat domain-containing protein n=1 Tax=Candidatus Odyssella thessalonicensis TaxID=84647 RepID=UPI000225B18B|nr:leucine-rich repeat domain-containing protein [Candidatus Odyssella thessalonicensis]